MMPGVRVSGNILFKTDADFLERLKTLTREG
jgi:hypothetical protein